jgi:hypothetical protein
MPYASETTYLNNKKKCTIPKVPGFHVHVVAIKLKVCLKSKNLLALEISTRNYQVWPLKDHNPDTKPQRKTWKKFYKNKPVKILEGDLPSEFSSTLSKPQHSV